MTAFIGMNVSGNYPAPSSTSVSAESGSLFGLGDQVNSGDGSKFVFVSASGASITSYQVVAWNSAGSAAAITSALALAGNRVGVAPYSISSGSHGWVQIAGVVSVNVLSTCSSATALYTTATAGALDDTSTSQVKIAGITILANITAVGSTAAFLGTEPFAAL
jgi:hypothetical protein